jgi:SnoaL-like domain
MDRDAAQEWLDRYVSAWETYDPDAIGALFAGDVTYRYHPDDEPVVGREAVVKSWLGETDSADSSSRDEPGTYTARYTPIAIDGDVVVATGVSTYYQRPGGPVDRVYDNCFVMRFDTEGRCRAFVEYYHKRG